MNVPLAWSNLTHQKTRLLVAIAGVAFAVLLMFMNLGFLGAVAKTASSIYEQLNADIFLFSPKSEMIAASRPFPRTRLYQSAGIGGVEQTMALYLTMVEWLNPVTRSNQRVLVYGFNPYEPVFLLPELQPAQAVTTLNRPDAVLIDRLSNPPLGYEPSDVMELNKKRVIVSGEFTLGSGFAASGTLAVNTQNFFRLFPMQHPDQIQLGLIQVRSPDQVEAIAATLRSRLPNDVLVLTKAEAIARENRFWIQTTSTGFIFNMGVAVSFMVGTAIVYQILTTDVREHLPEYATLKAIGYRNRYLFKVIVEEASLLATLGFVPGLLIALVLYQITRWSTNGGLPIAMSSERVMLVFTLTLLMCILSGLISVRKALQADPAEIF
ncbi:FtsX-like permease family protein [Oscillatoria sp. FACHB-1407]|uniref:ABC transporter permease DevC n=1 Tax=Oscillatoria sp. FACHB-1407 TaxID=2692847 RepID=UPI0016872964|nr:ABC transporter permease DevC [Oscillatoria sp. FACHB-1407]MBD2463116.1 FtsX-like permease family protein [Oscillatoria sp. FACHB-1407]